MCRFWKGDGRWAAEVGSKAEGVIQEFPGRKTMVVSITGESKK